MSVIITAADDSDTTVRLAVLEAIRDSDDQRVEDVLIQATKDSSKDVANSAQTALAGFTERTKKAALALSQAEARRLEVEANRDAQMREAAIKTARNHRAASEAVRWRG